MIAATLEGDLNEVSRFDEVGACGSACSDRHNSVEHGAFHLHGYDIEVEVGPGDATTMELVSDASGQFNITFHPGGKKSTPKAGRSVQTISTKKKVQR